MVASLYARRPMPAGCHSRAVSYFFLHHSLAVPRSPGACGLGSSQYTAVSCTLQLLVYIQYRPLSFLCTTGLQIREALAHADSDYDKEKLQERLAKLSGGVAVLKVSGGTYERNV